LNRKERKERKGHRKYIALLTHRTIHRKYQGAKTRKMNEVSGPAKSCDGSINKITLTVDVFAILAVLQPWFLEFSLRIFLPRKCVMG
jgi:hypothetical protein